MSRPHRMATLLAGLSFPKRMGAPIFIFLISLLYLASCGGAGGGGVDDSSSTGSDSDGAESGVSLETGGPVDMPVPIAKIDGVDPTSVRFEEEEQSDLVGTLFASTIGRVEGNVGMIKEGSFVDRRDTSSGNVEFDISESLLDITLALVVVGTGENEGSVSPPVLVRISKSKKLHVAITNLGNVQTTRLTLSEDDLVAFSAQSSSGSPVVGSVSIRGGEASVLTSEPSEALINLKYNPDGVLTGIGTSTALVYFVQTDGTTEVESASSGGLSAEDRFVSISPDGLWFLSNTLASGILRGTLASFDNPQEREILEDDDEPPSRLQLDWLSNSRAVAIKKFSNGGYEAQVLSGLSQAKAGNTSALQLKTLFTSLTPIAEPLAEGSGETFVYECEDTSGAVDLCQSDTSGNVTALVDGNVTHIEVPGDDRYVIYEISSGNGSDSCNNEIQLYNHETADATDLVTGCYPTPHPQDSDLIVYLGLFDETPQVGVINLDNYNLGLPASQLVLTGSTSANAGSCNRYLVNTVDSVGNAANVTVATSVNLSGPGTGAFYSNSNCSQAVSSVAITTGQNSAAFYYKGSSSETVKLTVSASGLAGATITVSVTFTSPTTLTLSGPTPLTAESCSSAYTVTTKNAQSETTAVAQDTQITLSGAGSGAFYSDSGCKTTISTVTITTGGTSATFYYENFQAETVTLSAGSGSLSTASLAVTVNPVPASSLSLSGKTSILMEECVAYTVTGKDYKGRTAPISSSQDTTLYLNATSVMGTYWSNSTCSNSIASAATSNVSFTFPSGKSSAIFYFNIFGSASVNPFTITVSSPSSSLTSSTVTVTVTNSP